MKKIIYTFVSIALFSINLLFAQAQEPISKVANISIPKNIKKANRQEIISFAEQHFKYPRITEDSKNVHQIGDVLISIWDLSNEKTLQQTQLTIEGIITDRELRLDNTIDESKIIAVNNIQFYVIKYHKDDEYTYLFYSENKNFKSVNGAIQFKKEQKAKADQIFDELIKSISFKK